MLEKLNNFMFEKEFYFAHSIEQSCKSSHSNESISNRISREIVSRVKAFGISFFATAALMNDLIYLTGHTVQAICFAVRQQKSVWKYSATTRNIPLNIVELVRHIFGAIFGSVVGLISPSTARKWFMPVDQSEMEIRPNNMTTDEATKLYAMLEKMDKIFNEHDIEYCMTGGTQLGATRHGGIIPWDDDADVFISNKDAINIENLMPELNSLGFGVLKCLIGFKLYDLNGKDIIQKDMTGDNLEYKYPFIDICVTNEIDGKITYVAEHYKDNYAGEYMKKTEWESRVKQKFGPIHLYGISNPTEFCKRAFGENVMNFGFALLNHKTYTKEIPYKVYLKRQSNDLCKPIEFDAKKFNDYVTNGLQII